MNKSQRAMAAARYIEAEQPDALLHESDHLASKRFGVSEGYIRKARRILEEDPETARLIEDGRGSISGYGGRTEACREESELVATGEISDRIARLENRLAALEYRRPNPEEVKERRREGARMARVKRAAMRSGYALEDWIEKFGPRERVLKQLKGTSSPAEAEQPSPPPEQPCARLVFPIRKFLSLREMRRDLEVAYLTALVGHTGGTRRAARFFKETGSRKIQLRMNQLGLKVGRSTR